MAGDPDDLYLIASDAGYGFVARLGDMISRNKAGKALLSVPPGAQVLPPARVHDPDGDRIAAITRDGHLLVTVLAELPRMARGKGNKIIGIPSARLKNREEYLVALQCVPAKASLTVHAGKKFKTMKAAELDEYLGERGKRGLKLPRGYQGVDRVEVEE
jgi:topoisomerase-4 subunit A